MPLTMADRGGEFSVRTITGKDETRKFLENLGFVEGASVSVISEIGGNLIVSIKGSRVAIDRSMASRIII